MTYRDMVIADLADENAELRDTVRSYRELTQSAVDTIATLTAENDRLTTRNFELLERDRDRRERRVA